MTAKDRILLAKMGKWAAKAEIDYQSLRSEFDPSPYSNAAILTAFSLAQIGNCPDGSPKIFRRHIQTSRGGRSRGCEI